MAHTAFARTYRPQTFAEIVGQERVSVTLGNAVTLGRIAQAYLFTGPRGTGKTSTARILAKAVNCETGMTPSPCGKCSNCLEIARSASFDVIEIDGASNRGIDNIRELRETVVFPPQKGRYKIYIIDEVHMLTNEAWNALLKTLEEPPAHVIFVFATTEPEKVLPTILSRCQRYDFRPIPAPEIVERLRFVTGKENVEADDAAMMMIARAADGGLRDALSILDQCVAFASAKSKNEKKVVITESIVTDLLGRVGSDIIADLVKRIESRDLAGIVKILDGVEDSGRNLNQLAHALIEHYREALLKETGKAGGSPVPLMRILDELMGALEKSKRSAHSRLHLELALFRAARAYERKIQLESVLEKLSRLEALIAGGTGIPSEEDGGESSPAPSNSGNDSTPGLFGGGRGIGQASASSASSRLIERDLSQKASSASVRTELPAEVEEVPVADGIIEVKETVSSSFENEGELDRLLAQWPKIVEEVKGVSITSAAVLIDARIESLTEDTVIIAFPGAFHRDKLERDAEAKAALAQSFSARLSRSVRVKFHLISSGPVERDEEKVDPKRTAEILKREPIVKAALEIFGGEIVEIKEASPAASGRKGH